MKNCLLPAVLSLSSLNWSWFLCCTSRFSLHSLHYPKYSLYRAAVFPRALYNLIITIMWVSFIWEIPSLAIFNPLLILFHHNHRLLMCVGGSKMLVTYSHALIRTWTAPLMEASPKNIFGTSTWRWHRNKQNILTIPSPLLLDDSLFSISINTCSWSMQTYL